MKIKQPFCRTELTDGVIEYPLHTREDNQEGNERISDGHTTTPCYKEKSTHELDEASDMENTEDNVEKGQASHVERGASNEGNGTMNDGVQNTEKTTAVNQAMKKVGRHMYYMKTVITVKKRVDQQQTKGVNKWTMVGVRHYASKRLKRVGMKTAQDKT